MATIEDYIIDSNLLQLKIDPTKRFFKLYFIYLSPEPLIAMVLNYSTINVDVWFFVCVA